MSVNYEALWSSGNPQSLLKLARDIESQDSWRGYLTTQEHEVFKYALEKGGEIWDEFINGDIICRLEQQNPSQSEAISKPDPTHNVTNKQENESENGEESSSTLLNNTDHGNEQNMSTKEGPYSVNQSLHSDKLVQLRLVNLDSVTVAFRVRYMLYEKSIQFLFPSPDPEVFPDIDYQILENNNINTQTALSSNINDSSHKLIPTKREIDDDYDDDDDDDDDKNINEIETEKSTKHNLNSSNSTSESPEIEHDSSGKHIITIPNIIPTESDLHKRRNAFRITVDRLYHIFEDDEDNLQKQKKLEESDQQMESDIDSSALSGKIGGHKAAFGAANLSLKHLLSAIQSNQSKLNISERELSTLLSDVRKNRSKWASEEKIGQEELYEAAEKVAIQLRATTEHSTPFLNKVNKRDAPNYFNIIKHPMDLNTVMKKLRALQYRCKKEFVDDLMLIWENCFQYNTDPKHYVRVHANAMKNKTLSLIPLIPDITIRDRAEVEAEEAKLQQLEDESDEEPKAGKHSTKGKKRKLHHESNSIEEAKDPIDLQTPAPDHSTTEQHSLESYSGYDQNTKCDPELNFGNLESVLYQEMFGEQALRYVSKRYELFRDNKLQIDSPALGRDPKAMGRFEECELDMFKTPEAKEEAKTARSYNGVERRLLDSVEDLGLERNDILVEYNTGCGIPGFPWNVSANNRGTNISGNANIENNQPSGYVNKSGQAKIFESNLEQIQIIRKLCSKIELIRQMQQQVYMHSTQFKSYEIQKINEKDLDVDSRLPNRDNFDKNASFSAFRRSIAKLAMHTGFEETETMAIEALTEIAAEFLSKLGRSVALWMESSQPDELTLEDILLTVLEESGIEGVADLDTYVRDDIEKHSQRLLDHKKKLTTFLSDLLKPVSDLTDGEFNDGSEQFISGDFSEEIGDDFFGFRELGLEDELGLTSLSVPLHILQNRSFNFNIDHNQTMLKSHLSQIPEYDPIDLHVSERQLTPVKAALLKRLDTMSCTTILGDGKKVLLEGDQLPPKQRNSRPKVPPTGKLPTFRRKPISKVFFLPDTY